MAKAFSRSQRVAEQILRELADIIRHELKDPRIGMLTITDVEVTKDCSHAKVFFTMLNSAEQVKDTSDALTRAAGFLRSQLSQRMTLFSVPQLHFLYDNSVETGMRLSQLIDEAVAEDTKRNPE